MVSAPSPTTTIDRAIVPAAGYGTRLRPLTLAIPKEMLPLGRKPVLEHVVEELVSAGIRKILFVVSPGKELIERYFGEGARWSAQCEYVVQPVMKGLGDALLRAESWCAGHPALVAFGDCVIESSQSRGPAIRLLAAFRERHSDAAVLAERVSPESVSRYGVLAPDGNVAPGTAFGVSAIIEKPAPEDAPSDLAVAGRWIVGPRVFELLKRTAFDPNGELSLTDAIANGLRHRLRVCAVPLRAGEARRDIGGWETYLSAAAEYALRDEEFGSTIKDALFRSG